MKKSGFLRAEPTSRLFIVAVTVVVVLSLLTVSCGHGKSVGSGLAPTGQKTGAPRHAPTLDAILREIDAYQPPKGVDAARFAMLKAELRRQVVAQKTEKAISAAPSGAWDAVTDLDITTDTGGTQAALTWTERLRGDFDNSSDVNIADLIPVAVYYAQRTDQGPDDPHKLVQGDTDPVISIGDLQAICSNYGAHLQGYRIYRGAYVGGSIIWETTWRPNMNPDNPDWSIDRPYPPPVSTRPAYTYIDNIRTLPDKTNVRYKLVAYGDAAEGVTSDPAIMPPPGTFYISGTITWWGSGVPNVLVQLTPGGLSGIGKLDGTYRVYGATNGTYTATPSKTNWTFTPPSLQVVVSGGNVASVNFTATPGLADTAWPKFRANARNTGLSTHVGPQTSAVKWTHTIGYPVKSSPAIGPSGTLYVGSEKGFLHALRPADGSEAWEIGIGTSVPASPAVGADGRIYESAYDGTAWSFGEKTLDRSWFHTLGGFTTSSPALSADAAVYIGCQDNKLYALNAGDGSVKWTYSAGGMVNSSPAIGADGTVFVGSADGNTYALNPSDGSLKWAAQTGQVETAPAVAADGTIYVGTFNSNVRALNPADGSVKWTCPVVFWVTASPAIGPDGTVYAAAGGDTFADNYVYSINPVNGSIRWQHLMPAGLGSSPAIGADGVIYLGCLDGKVYALNPSDGSVKWTYQTGSAVRSSPAIGADGTLYVGSNDGKVYAFGQ